MLSTYGNVPAKISQGVITFYDEPPSNLDDYYISWKEVLEHEQW